MYTESPDTPPGLEDPPNTSEKENPFSADSPTQTLSTQTLTGERLRLYPCSREKKGPKSEGYKFSHTTPVRRNIPPKVEGTRTQTVGASPVKDPRPRRDSGRSDSEGHVQWETQTSAVLDDREGK